MKLYLNIIVQLSAVLVIISLFLFEGLDIEKLKFLFKKEVFFLFLYIILLKLLIAFLFFKVVNLLTAKKNYFNDIGSTFLQGGLINQLLPAAGLIFRYYKFKNIHNMSLAQYSSSQAVLSISSLISYLMLSILFGFIIIINFNIEFFLYFLLFLIFLLISIYIIKDKLYNAIKIASLKIWRITSLINELIKIKNLISNNKTQLFYIFIGFFFLAALECTAFYFVVYLYEVEITFTKAIFLYINTSLLTVILLINFIGLFEIILVLSSSLILANYTDMIYVSLGFKVLNTSALITTIILFMLVNIFKKNN